MTDTRRDELGQRELLIEAILGVRTPDGSGLAGIWGREVCQVCGELGDYVGYWPAVCSHQGGQFHCIGHEHPPKRIPQQPWTTRHCEVCTRAFPLAELRRSGHRWVCRACDSPASSDDELDARLKRLARARFLDARCPDELSLLSWLNRQYSLAGGLNRLSGGDHDEEVTELDEVRRLLGELADGLGDVASSLRARDEAGEAGGAEAPGTG